MAGPRPAVRPREASARCARCRAGKDDPAPSSTARTADRKTKDRERRIISSGQRECIWIRDLERIRRTVRKALAPPAHARRLLIPDSIPIEKDNGAGGLTGRWKKVSAQPAAVYGQRYPAGVYSSSPDMLLFSEQILLNPVLKGIPPQNSRCLIDVRNPRRSGRPLKDRLEKLYEQYNRPEHIHPDPLEFVHLYTDRPDREVAGFIASALAYGRVRQIHFQRECGPGSHGALPFVFSSAKLRGRDPRHIPFLQAPVHDGRRPLGAARRTEKADYRIRLARILFSQRLRPGGREISSPLFPTLLENRTLPLDEQCLCFTFTLRGQRVQTIEPFHALDGAPGQCRSGVWRGVSPSHLVIPLDTHMHRIALALGLTHRKQADMRCAR